jgi:hypothetical protein
MAFRMTQHTSRRPFARAGLACLASVALGLPVALVACWPTTGGDGGSGSSSAAPTATTDPPVIQSLDMNGGAITPVNDTYTVVGSITYEDDDDVVSTVQVNVPVIGKTYSIPVADPASTAAGEPFYFTVSADPPLGGAGPTNYIVTLVNKSGAISAGVEKSMDLE